MAWLLKHDPEKWQPVFRKRSCPKNKLKRNGDSTYSHFALAVSQRRAENKRVGGEGAILIKHARRAKARHADAQAGERLPRALDDNQRCVSCDVQRCR